MSKIIIDKLVPGGQGIATLPNGKKAFFWNVLPGEIVTAYDVTKKKTHYLEAVATQIEQPSPHRITPRDPHFPSTSPWQIMDYDYELQQKSALLLESFRQAGIGNSFSEGAFAVTTRSSEDTRDVGLAKRPEEKLLPLPATDGQDFFYRNKMEYSLYYSHDDQQIHLAFHQRGSHRKIPIENSSLERPEILARAQEIIADLNARGEEARKYQSILLRCNQAGQVSGGLFENHKPHPVFPNLTDTILGYQYSYSPNGFFQINLPVYELALQEIKRHIKTQHVLDLYAGVGTIGLSVAREHDLTLVEIDQSAFTELERNCTGTTATPIHAKSEEALNFIQPDQTVILDPPRAGCNPALLQKLLNTLPSTIIYLSCNPATQARDVKILSAKYHITHLQPYNFFPRTPHLENLVILRPKDV